MANLGGVVVQIVADDQVEASIAIVIDETGGHGPARIVDPGFARDILETKTPQVYQQSGGSVLRDDEVREPIVVGIARDGSHAASLQIGTGTGGDIDKRVVWRLFPEPVSGGMVRAPILDTIDIGQAVVVEVLDDDARAHLVGHEPVCACDMGEREVGGGGCVAEPGGGGGGRRWLGGGLG